MAAVSAEDVRDVLHVGDSTLADEKALKMIKRAKVALELELSLELDYLSCTDAQKEAITVLAAIYAVCYLTGGSAVGLNFRVGDLSVDQNASSIPALSVLQNELERLLNGLRGLYVGSA